jgi:hypothetical protein
VGAGEAGILAFLITHTLFTDSGHVLDFVISLYSGAIGVAQPAKGLPRPSDNHVVQQRQQQQALV